MKGGAGDKDHHPVGVLFSLLFDLKTQKYSELKYILIDISRNSDSPLMMTVFCAWFASYSAETITENGPRRGISEFLS